MRCFSSGECSGEFRDFLYSLQYLVCVLDLPVELPSLGLDTQISHRLESIDGDRKE
jgi:hypothetical protein